MLQKKANCIAGVATGSLGCVHSSYVDPNSRNKANHSRNASISSVEVCMHSVGLFVIICQVCTDRFLGSLRVVDDDVWIERHGGTCTGVIAPGIDGVTRGFD